MSSNEYNKKEPQTNTQEGYIADTAEPRDDSLTFSNAMIEKIVAHACMQVDGVEGMRGDFLKRMKQTITGAESASGVDVEVSDDGSVIVNIALLIAFGAYAPDIFEAVRKNVIDEIKKMTGLDVSAINVRVEDVVMPGEKPDTAHKD